MAKKNEKNVQSDPVRDEFDELVDLPADEISEEVAPVVDEFEPVEQPVEPDLNVERIGDAPAPPPEPVPYALHMQHIDTTGKIHNVNVDVSALNVQDAVNEGVKYMRNEYPKSTSHMAVSVRVVDQT